MKNDNTINVGDIKGIKTTAKVESTESVARFILDKPTRNKRTVDVEITKTTFEIRWRCSECEQESYHYIEVASGTTCRSFETFCPSCNIDIEIKIYPSKSAINMKATKRNKRNILF